MGSGGDCTDLQRRHADLVCPPSISQTHRQSSLPVDGAHHPADDGVGGVCGAVQVELRLEAEQRPVAGLAALHLDQTATRGDVSQIAL